MVRQYIPRNHLWLFVFHGSSSWVSITSPGQQNERKGKSDPHTPAVDSLRVFPGVWCLESTIISSRMIHMQTHRMIRKVSHGTCVCM